MGGHLRLWLGVISLALLLSLSHSQRRTASDQQRVVAETVGNGRALAEEHKGSGADEGGARPEEEDREEAKETLTIAVVEGQLEGLRAAGVVEWLARGVAPHLGRPVRILPQGVRLGSLSAGPRALLLVSATPLRAFFRERARSSAALPPLGLLFVGASACATDDTPGEEFYLSSGAAFVLRTHLCGDGEAEGEREREEGEGDGNSVGARERGGGAGGAAAVQWLPPAWATAPAVRSFAGHRHRCLPPQLRALDYVLVGSSTREAQQMQRAAEGAACVGEVRLHAAFAGGERRRAAEEPAAAYCALLAEARAALVPAGPRTPVQEPARLAEALQHCAAPLMLSSASPLGRGLARLGLSMRNVRRELAPLLARVAGDEGPALVEESQRLWEGLRRRALAQAAALVSRLYL